MLVNVGQRIVKTTLEVKIHFIHTSGLVNRISGEKKRIFLNSKFKLRQKFTWTYALRDFLKIWNKSQGQHFQKSISL